MEKEIVLKKDQLEKLAENLFDVDYNTWNDFIIELTNPYIPRLQAVGTLINVNKGEG